MKGFKKLKKRYKALTIISAVIAALILAAAIFLHVDNRGRLLNAVIHFSTSTLNSSEYILSGIDIMELCQEYGNSDTLITGHAAVNDLETVNSSMFVDLEAVRAMSQKKLSAHSIMKYLWIEAGDIFMYAKGDTVYMDAPMMGNARYAFVTGNDLFVEMPAMTSDIDQSWFIDNASNILEFINQIRVEKPGGTFTDEDGTVCEEIKITIPVGSGDFIWELMGTEPPNKELSASIYLDKASRARKLYIATDDVAEGAEISIEGKNMSRATAQIILPDGEKAVATIERNKETGSRIDAVVNYYTYNNEDLCLSGYITWERHESDFDVKMKDLELTKDGALAASGYFAGNVTKIPDYEKDAFEGAADFSTFEVLQWKDIRGDIGGFTDGLIANTAGAGLVVK